MNDKLKQMLLDLSPDKLVEVQQFVNDQVSAAEGEEPGADESKVPTEDPAKDLDGDAEVPFASEEDPGEQKTSYMKSRG